MEKADLLTVVVGMVIVLVIALLANPQYLAGLSPSASAPKPVSTPATPVPGPGVTETLIPIVIATPEPVVTPTPKPADAPMYRIFYSDSPFTYPRYKMPENMETFGATDIPPRSSELVPFAFIEDTRGGVTQKFSVPYPVWVLNITVNASRTPQYGNLQMILCYASNGKILDGAELLNQGTMYRVIETSNTDLYMVITTRYIDNYRIQLETPRSYYDQYRPQ